MALSPETVQAVIARLYAKIGDRVRPCAVCGNEEFNLADRVVNLEFSDNPAVLPVLGPSAVMGLNAIATFLVINCTNCGNSYFLNANVLGVMDLLTGTVPGVAHSQSAVHG